jgi:hypothetical protein
MLLISINHICSMKKNIKTMKNLLLPLMALGLMNFFLQSCKEDDECEGVACSANQTCEDGTCVDVSENELVQGFISQDVTWTADKVYELSGRVVVRSGATLSIEAGTLIKGQEGTGSSASVLIVERGAMIDAQGTATSPIIFTSQSDNIKPGEIAGSNLDETVNELWWGLIILGNAPVSTEDGDVLGQVEGIPSNETYGQYGGSDANDNSGTLTYVSIRHGGITIGDGNEINGLTLGGVGAGTTIDHIEIVANLDDGVEFFGGTVNASNIIVIYQGDDGIDIDQNYSGTIDNVIVISGDGIGTDEALEIDGPENSTYTTGLFTIRNGSFINEGTSGSAGDLKSKAQGTIENCTFEGFTSGLKIRASFSDTTLCTEKEDSYAHLSAASPSLIVRNNQFGTNSTLADYVNVYSGSCTDCSCPSGVEGNSDNIIAADGNTAAASVSGGAVRSEFSNWTWAAERGKL